MNRTMIRGWAGTVVRLALAVIWALAAYAKLQEPRTFLRAVRAYNATPEWLSKAIAYGLPVLEVSIAVLLFVGLATRVVAIVAATLFGVFIIGIAQAGARGIKLDCGCFGGGGATNNNTTYLLDSARDIGLLALAVFLIIWPITRLSVDEILTDGADVTPPSAKRVRRDPKAIQRYQAMRKARQREVAGRQRFIASTVAVVVVLTALIGISVQSSRAKIQGSLEATNASVANGVTVGKATAPVTLDVFEDFQCPICEQFETTTAADLNKLVTAGSLKINYHMMAFLDSSSNGNLYSSRAANAALCASDISVDAFTAYHSVLYGKDSTGAAVQPTEGTNGRTDTQLISYLKQALPTVTADQISTFTTCLSSQSHSALVQGITDNSSKRGVSGTPTVKVNGKTVDTVNTANVLKAITDAEAKIKAG